MGLDKYMCLKLVAFVPFLHCRRFSRKRKIFLWRKKVCVHLIDWKEGNRTFSNLTQTSIGRAEIESAVAFIHHQKDTIILTVRRCHKWYVGHFLCRWCNQHLRGTQKRFRQLWEVVRDCATAGTRLLFRGFLFVSLFGF